MMLRKIGCVLPLMALLVVPVQAQQGKLQPTVEEVLAQVSENFHTYLHSVPNLFAEEQMETDVNVNAGGRGLATAHGTALDGIYYLRRNAQNGLLEESRQLKSIDHKPVREDVKPQTPVMEENIFSYAPSFVSPSLVQCYDYKLLTGQRLQKQPVIVIEYKLKRLPPRTGCPVHEPHSGREFVDPGTMQILRIEQRREEHPLGALVKDASLHGMVEDRDTGTWNWAIDYAPVELNGKTFMLPRTISANTSTNRPPDVRWTFVAHYRNYHLLHVQSKLLPGYAVQK